MDINISTKKLQQLVNKIDAQSKLLETWKLEGGVSAQVIAIEIERDNSLREKFVLRLYGEADFKNNPNIAGDEFKLLTILHSKGLKVPKSYIFSHFDDIFSTPYLVIEYIDGKIEDNPSDVNDFLHQLVVQLTNIHNTDYPDLSFLPDKNKVVTTKLNEKPEKIDAELNEGKIRQTLIANWPFSQTNKSGLLHGDFWPGNTLWKNNQLIAVIDWEDAQRGDPLADVANCRLEVLWKFGMQAMENFTNEYKTLSDRNFKNLPYWDLIAALKPCGKIWEWGLSTTTLNKMVDNHKLFVNQAMEKMSS